MKKLLFISLLFFAMFLFLGCNGGDKTASAPSGLKIENGVVTFDEVSNATSYKLELVKDGSTQTIDVKSGDTLKDLTFGSYQAKVKAVFSDGSSSEWSSVVTFSITKLSAPSNVKINNSKLYWDNVEGATKYLVTFKGQTEIQKELKSGQLLTNLGLPADEYKITVQALNDDSSATSDASSEVTFTIELEQLDVPTGLYIEENYLFFDVMGATNDYTVKFVSGETVIERDVTSGGADISELLIPAGTYEVSIKAKGDGVSYKDSEYSDAISFTKETVYMELKEKDLVNAGYIKWMGRTYYNESNKVNEVYHSASGFELFFKGSIVTAVITATNYNSTTYRPCIVIVIDDDFDNATTLFLDKASQEITLATNDDINEHKIDLYKRSESIDSHIAIESIKTDGIFVKKIVSKELKMEFIAASSSTGYGNLGSPSSGGKTTENSDALKGFAFLTAQALNADVNIFSASGWGCNASQWTSPNTLNVPDAYKYVDFHSSVPWSYGYYVPDVVVVNLGTNDWSYINAATNADEKDRRMTAFFQKYVQFLKQLHDYYPDAQLIVLYGLMNESSVYEITESIVKTAKLSIPDLAVIKINGDAQGYNSHPSAKSHKEIAAKLTEFIKTLLDK